MNRKKSVRWSSEDKAEDVSRETEKQTSVSQKRIWDSRTLLAISFVMGITGILAVGEVYIISALEKLASLIVPGFFIGVIFYYFAAYVGDKWTTVSKIILLMTCLVSEALSCFLMHRPVSHWVFILIVHFPLVLVTAYSSLTDRQSLVVIGLISSARFLSLLTVTFLPLALRPYFIYSCATFGVIAVTITVSEKQSPKASSVENSAASGSNDTLSEVIKPSRDCCVSDIRRRGSLPIVQNQLKLPIIGLSKKMDLILAEMLSSQDVSDGILKQIQALRDILQSPQFPEKRQRSKSISHVTLFSDSDFSNHCNDLPYTFKEDTSYASQCFHRNVSWQATSRCRHSGQWQTNISQLDLDLSLQPLENGFEESQNCLKFNNCATSLFTDSTFDDEGNQSITDTAEHSRENDCVQIDSEQDRISPDNSPRKVKSMNSFHLKEESSDASRSFMQVELLKQWDYPILDLALNAPDTMLSKMVHKLFVELGFMETFSIPRKEFIQYFHSLELGYRNNPYHNRIHATDVLHAVYYITSQRIYGFTQLMPEDDYGGHSNCDITASDTPDNGGFGIMAANFLPLELMSMLTAAAMHDYDHPGRTNAFLIATCHPLAVLYNNRSVLENHHVASAWSSLISHPEHAWFQNFSDVEFKRFRFLVIEEILATDLGRHFEILADFNAKVNEESGSGLDWTIEDDRLMVSRMVIKMADINGPCKIKDLHLLWTERIAEEFYQQGDEELSSNISVSPYMDRTKPDQLAKLQESFITHLVGPLCYSLCGAGLLPNHLNESSADKNGGEFNSDGVTCVMVKNLEENYSYWVHRTANGNDNVEISETSDIPP